MVDFAIASQVQAPQPNLPGAVQGANALRDLVSKNAIRNILSRPDAVSQNGQISGNALKDMMAVDPTAASQVQQNSLRTQGMETEVFDKKLKLAQTVGSEALESYESAMTAGQPEQAARQAAQDVYSKGIDRLKTSGLFGDHEQSTFNPQFDPTRVRMQVMGVDKYYQMQEQRKREANTERHQTTQEDLERDRIKASGDAGWTIVNTDKGQFRYNARTGEMTNLDKSPVTVKPTTITGKPTSGGDTPARAAEADAMAIANDRIAKKEQELGHPLDAAERADIRQGARADPKIQEAFRKQETTAISDDAAALTAEETLRGDWHGTVGMGRNAASMRKIADERARIAKERGMTGADLAANTAEFNGIMSAERVLGTRGAGIDLGISEAQKFAPMVLELSNRIDRTRFPTVNAMQLAIQKGIGGEDVVRLTDALNAYKMAYTQILTRGGMPTDDSRRRSDEVIDQAWSNGQIKAAIDQLNKEMMAARSAVPEVRDNLYFSLTGKKRTSEVLPTTLPTAGQAAPPSGTTLTQEQLAAAPKITADDTGKAKWAALPDHTLAIGPDGQPHWKGGPPPAQGPASTAPTTTAQPKPAAPAAESPQPQSWAIPEARAKDPDGTTYNGGKFVKRGDRIVPAQSTAPADEAASLERARAAIKAGADPAKVNEMLRGAGIDPGKL